MRGCDRDHDSAGPRPGGRRGGVPRAHRPLPARAAAALLPDPRLGAGRRGHAAGDAAGRLARARPVRGTRLGARLAVQDRDQPVPERAARHRPPPGGRGRGQWSAPPPEPTRRAEPLWLQPYPDALLDDLPDTAPGPEARYETREAVALAFVAGLQRLPPRQRAVLVLRDVLGYPAAQAADMLAVSEVSVNSALQRARATLAAQLPAAGRDSAPAPRSARERELTSRFADAFEAADTDRLVALLTEDAWLTMPPEPLEYQGHAAIAEFFQTRPWWGAQAGPAGAYPRQRPARVRLLPRRPARAGRARPWPRSCSRWPATRSAPSPGSATTACSPTSGCPGPCRASRILPEHPIW